MKLLLINGSPRGLASNSKVLADKFLVGFGDKHHMYDTVFLKRDENVVSDLTTQLLKYSHIILIFPLYTDAMPAMVKLLIEEIGSAKLNLEKVSFGFIIQSGFPESYQSEFIAAYMKKFTKRIGAEYLGTIIKGGVEGIKIQPKWMTGKVFSNFVKLGEAFAISGQFDKQISKNLAKPRHLSFIKLVFYRVLGKMGVTNFYWDNQLKNNKAFDNRFAQPYN